MMRPDKMRAELERIVRECGSRVQGIGLSGDDLEAVDKNEMKGAHFSTIADRTSQQIAIESFRRAFPGEIIIAEEDKHENSIPADCIVFDPLDGTTNFYNHIRDWGVSACMLRGGKPFVSATYFANNGEVVTAARGEGCFSTLHRNGLKAFKIPAWHGNLDKTTIGTDVGPWVHKSGTFDAILRPLSREFNISSPMAAVEGGRRVLLGQLGAYYNIGVAKIWDAAAMVLAIEEAGGVVCAPDGGSVRWNTLKCDWIMARNRELADIVLEYSKPWAART